MDWPPEITAAFLTAITAADPSPGNTKEGAVQYLLDEAARRASKRCDYNPANLAAAYRQPFTPIGELTASGLDGRLLRFTLGGDTSWGKAIDRLYLFVEENATLIVEMSRRKA